MNKYKPLIMLLLIPSAYELYNKHILVAIISIILIVILENEYLNTEERDEK